MYGKGVFEIEPGKRGFKFGTYAGSITQQSSGKKIQELFSSMFDANKDENGDVVAKENSNTINHLLHYFYGGAVAYAQWKDLKAPNIVEVGDWIDEIGLTQAFKFYYESLVGPNAETPDNEKKNPGEVKPSE